MKCFMCGDDKPIVRYAHKGGLVPVCEKCLCHLIIHSTDKAKK